MNKTIKTISLSFLFLLICNTTQAQFWKKLQKKAEEKVEREAERRAQKRVDKKIDKTFDEAEEELDGKKKKKRRKKKKKSKSKSDSDSNSESTNEEQKSQDIMSGIFGDMMSGKEVKTKSSYTFNIKATMQVTDYTKRKEETMQMIQSYGKNAIMSELESPKNIIINDFENEAVIMIEPSKKTARIMSLSFLKKMNKQEPLEENETAKMTKTGKTKTMNGYICHQYIITDKNIKVDAWFAPEVNFDYQDYLSGFSKMFGNKKSNTTSLLNKGQGYVMEMTAFEKGKKVSEMKITELSETPTTIKLSDYTIQKMF